MKPKNIIDNLNSDESDKALSAKQGKVLNEKFNYSIEEKVIGKWIDGEPLYRRVLTKETPTVATDGTFVQTEATISSDIDFAFIEHIFVVDSNNQKQPLPYFNNAGYSCAGFVNALKNLVIKSNGTAYNNTTVYASILYTKTTD